MTKRFQVLLSLIMLVVLWTVASGIFGESLVPGPVATVHELLRMVIRVNTWRHVCLTVFRGTAGLILATAGAYVIGIPCGLNGTVMRLLSPWVTAMQSCPPIVWISLLLVWAGVGATVPILVVAAAVFPVLFLNIAQGTAAIDRRLFAMATVYRLPRRTILRHIVLPGISRYALAAFSFALGVTWKVTATAEFFGSGTGIGARIYWSYRVLDMPRLFAWTVLIMTVGVILETGLIHPIRDRLKTEDDKGGADE